MIWKIISGAMVGIACMGVVIVVIIVAAISIAYLSSLSSFFLGGPFEPHPGWAFAWACVFIGSILGIADEFSDR